jgi:glycosyltransferase involved in cell wall biosynthesis
MNLEIPKVSVLLPVYNGEKYLAEAIESVLCQSFDNFELIIINDGSTDSSLEIIEKYSLKDSRVKLINNFKNIGFAGSLNKGIAAAKGKYIARIDSDDTWVSEYKLQEQFEFLEKNPEYGVVGTSIIFIDEEKKIKGYHRPALLDRDIRSHFLVANQLYHSSVLIRKKSLENVGLYTEDKKYYIVEDYDLWLRIGKKYKLANLAGYYTKYMINKKGMSLSNEYKLKRSDLLLTFKYSDYYPHFFRSLMTKIFLFPLSYSIRSKIRQLKIFDPVRSRLTGLQSPRKGDDIHCYDDNFFVQQIKWQKDYKIISDWIALNIKGEIYGDLGCGNGYIIENLLKNNSKKVWGVDGSEKFFDHVDRKLLKHVKVVDLTKIQRLPLADVALCMEVAEHIPFEYSDILLSNIISTSADIIIFTAATPNQKGTNHINLQPHDYWIKKFQKKGYNMNQFLSKKFKKDLRGKLKYTPWYLKNFMVFNKSLQDKVKNF